MHTHASQLDVSDFKLCLYGLIERDLVEDEQRTAMSEARLLQLLDLLSQAPKVSLLHFHQMISDYELHGQPVNIWLSFRSRPSAPCESSQTRSLLRLNYQR